MSVDPRVVDRHRRGVFAACDAFNLTRGDRLEVATVLLNQNVDSFRQLGPGEWERLWFAFNGAVLVARILMERKAGQRIGPTHTLVSDTPVQREGNSKL